MLALTGYRCFRVHKPIYWISSWLVGCSGCFPFMYTSFTASDWCVYNIIINIRLILKFCCFVEFLPRLQPRYYSVACSPDASPNHFDVVFNVEQLPDRVWMKQQSRWLGCYRCAFVIQWVCARYGVCSGWLSRLGQQIMTKNGESCVDPPKNQEQVSCQNIYMFTECISIK